MTTTRTVRAPRRALALVVILCAATLIGQPTAGAAPSSPSAPARPLVIASGVEFRAQQFNICSVAKSHCPNAPDTGAALLYAISRWDSYGAWSLSLNEACVGDASTISPYTAPFDMYVSSLSEPRCSGVPWFGNTLHMGGIRRSGSPVSQAFPTQSGGGNNGFVCVLADTFIGRLANCSTHLYNGSTAVAQANELAFYLGFDSRLSPYVNKVVAGDFNLRPPGGTVTPKVPPVWPDNYVSTYNLFSHSTQSGSSLNKQLDYIWVSKAAGITTSTQTRWCEAGASDHCEVGARFER